jgi:hypothetical protein
MSEVLAYNIGASFFSQYATFFTQCVSCTHGYLHDKIQQHGFKYV